MNTQPTLQNLFQILYRSFLIQVKERAVQDLFILMVLVQPVLFTIMAVVTYFHGGRTELGLYAVIGAGMIGMWNNNLWASGAIVSNERHLGTLSLLLVSPASLPWVLFGKSSAVALTSVLAIGVSLLTGSWVFGLKLDILDPIGFVLSLLLAIFALTCLGMVMGSLFVLTRHSHMALQVANYPIYLLSGLTVPLTLLPLWTRPVSFILAPTWGNLSLNQSAQGIRTDLMSNFLWLIGLSIFYLLIACYLYRIIEYRVREAGNLEVW
jgi:ABC-2 type transport system permease protein